MPGHAVINSDMKGTVTWKIRRRGRRVPTNTSVFTRSKSAEIIMLAAACEI